jgi:hypothetical protein
MPKYYLHIRDCERLIKDHEGVELPDIVSAKEEAEQAAREILADKVRTGAVVDGDGQKFEIYDAWGNHMISVPFRSVLRLK